MCYVYMWSDGPLASRLTNDEWSAEDCKPIEINEATRWKPKSLDAKIKGGDGEGGDSKLSTEQVLMKANAILNKVGQAPAVTSPPPVAALKDVHLYVLFSCVKKSTLSRPGRALLPLCCVGIGRVAHVQAESIGWWLDSTAVLLFESALLGL